ncbi:MAG: DNA repair protein RadC [Clostridia bacterium]|nr:DNA repair protein RadC [Clostridia bacterium]
MATGHRRRVMEKVFKYGVDALYEHEFLELCLFYVYKRCDTNHLAHALLDKFGNLDSVCNATEKELMSVEGIGPAAAEFIKIIPHIARGYSLHTSSRKRKIYKTNESIYKRCLALVKGEKKEVAYVLCFDNKRHLIKEVKIGEGTAGSVHMDPRKIVDAVANTSTTSVMICHNHPSGVSSPSQQDFMVTKSIKDLLKPLEIRLIDHIAITDGDYVSCVVY